MKKYAEITDNIITNIAKYQDDAEIPEGWIDVTGVSCGIEDPIIYGVPAPRAYEPPWADDLNAWLDQVVRPQRDAKMDLFEWRISRYDREIRMGRTPTDDMLICDTYMQKMADLTTKLTEIVDQIPWPEEPL